ncbi:MAG TPA: (d)CMP kinase, partial [Candidatus Deferrimicrobiaceae bacterium]|nr:(d)CMP kinase [Candidatus Deferrimicrobiaceae bacterium]
GAGKTTASKRLAERASLTRLDTGAMYRACALAARRAGIPWSDGGRLGRVCAEMAITFREEGGEARVLLAGEDVSEAIRTPEISMGASEVSVHAPVREALVALQRKMGEKGGVVLEGRDTGTVVFPEADAKFFLDAHAAVRALRRYREWGAGEGKTYEEVLKDVLRRDIQDSTREHSPLRVADGAVYIDSTTLSVEEVVAEMLRHLPGSKVRGGAGGKP